MVNLGLGPQLGLSRFSPRKQGRANNLLSCWVETLTAKMVGWCRSPDLSPDLTGRIPGRPTREDAAAALRLIRDTFKTLSARA